MKGNFQLDVVGVNVHFDYVVNPPDADHSSFDLVFFQDGTTLTTDTAHGNVMTAQLIPLSNVVFQRVEEQKSIRPTSVGVSVK